MGPGGRSGACSHSSRLRPLPHRAVSRPHDRWQHRAGHGGKGSLHASGVQGGGLSLHVQVVAPTWQAPSPVGLFGGCWWAAPGDAVSGTVQLCRLVP